MGMGLIEICLLVLIALILFGPAVYKRFQKYQNLYLKRNKRLAKVVAQRKAEKLAREKIRNAKIKTVVFSVLGAVVLSSVVYLSLWPVRYPVNAYEISAENTVATAASDDVIATTQEGSLSVAGYQNITQVRYYNDWIYAVAESGVILRIRENGTGLTELVCTGGEIISFDFDADDNIIFTDAQYDKTGGALLMVSFDGIAVAVEPLLTSMKGNALAYPAGVEVAADGTIYFLNATDVSVVQQGGALQATRTAQAVHTQTGTLYAYDPTTGNCEEVASGLGFGTGLALSADESVIYLSQFADASVWAIDVTTRNAALGDAGTTALCTGLAGYPSGLSVAEDGTLWVSVLCSQMSWFERLSDLPAWREVLMRLPQGTRDALMKYNGSGMAIALDADGSLIASYTLSGSNGLKMLESAVQVGDCLYYGQTNKTEEIGYFVVG